MVLDYSGRKPVSKNRPRKQPVGIFAVILISAVSMSFALGLLTGWFVFRPAQKAAESQTQPAAAASGAPGASPQQTRFPNPEGGAARGGDPPLTFYETLPKGGKAVIGSGLNPGKPEQPQPLIPVAAPTAPSQQQAVQQPPNPPAAVKAEERKEQGQPPAEQAKKGSAADPASAPKQAAAGGKFCVQIASTKERKEAESLKAKLAEKGLPAYIVESNIKDRGTWFRVRVGKHLSQQGAGDLAVRAGKGAIVIPE